MSWHECRKKLNLNIGFKLIVEPIVWQDIDEAIEWYKIETFVLEEYFLKNFEFAKDKILLHPQIHTQVTHYVRRMIHNTFHY